ncbi:conserved hypothetical protein [Ricinus communis]|uniref:Uncharacterized protein n=1 Tax=Ricinus communis TaxID=3988 RepID=B9TNX4_RICCO|nr:conserved hypothetical protein [Ricinus communis]
MAVAAGAQFGPGVGDRTAEQQRDAADGDAAGGPGAPADRAAEGDAVENRIPEHHQREQHGHHARHQVLLGGVGADIADGKGGGALQQHPALGTPRQQQPVAAHRAPRKQHGRGQRKTVDHRHGWRDLAQLQRDSEEGRAPD